MSGLEEYQVPAWVAALVDMILRILLVFYRIVL
jgi:hypothetical protein